MGHEPTQTSTRAQLACDACVAWYTFRMAAVVANI